MLIDYPVKFDTEAIPKAENWSEESSVIENVNQTEAGTDQAYTGRRTSGAEEDDERNMKKRHTKP